ncbi:RidA family protein [Acidipila sp. EB88]|uniref:RidA family protein n=1 Tax=Acidipila sp. EB88 TaxID=2305226 RepID=UPI000F5EA73B|nr:RidA family protein [Acidipila sp. EB88]RRA47675.1 RidA family protein [Acidipila sp. EB88]
MTIERIESNARMSQAVVHGNTVYLAGQVAYGARGGSVSEQMKDALARVDALLSEAHSAKDRILSVSVFLTDMSTFAEMNEVWDAWIDPTAPPARITLGVLALGSSDFNLEISVVAAVCAP